MRRPISSVGLAKLKIGPCSLASRPEVAANHPEVDILEGVVLRFSELMRLTFGLTVDKCPACGGRMKLRTLVRDPASIERFLRHQGLWSEPSAPSPARAPPYQRAVTRLLPTRQQQLFADT